MHLILTGATGLVGTVVLDAMIKANNVTKISVISRRPVKLTDDRVNVILHSDFTSYDSNLLSQLQGAEGCVWALGISQTQVNKEDYIKITKTMPLAAARAFQTLQSTTEPKEPFHFVYVSGLGATVEPGRFTQTFARVKGEAELALGELQEANPSAFRATTVRPGHVDWTGHDELKPFLPEFGVLRSALDNLMSPVMRYAAKSFSSPTEPLGRFLADMAAGMWDGSLDGEGVERLSSGLTVVENTGMRRILGLDSVKRA